MGESDYLLEPLAQREWEFLGLLAERQGGWTIAVAQLNIHRFFVNYRSFGGASGAGPHM